MRGATRDLIVAVLSAGVGACTILAPSDEELYDGRAPSQPGRGGRPSGGAGGTATGGASGANAGTGAGGTGGTGGASAGDGGASFAGEAGAGGSAGSRSDAPAAGGGAGGAGGASGGSGGSEPVCAKECGVDEECTATATGAECTCVAGFVRDGTACRLPRSCAELHSAAPALASAAYRLQPAGDTSSFLAYCGMALEGGGWTLAVSEGPTFDPTTMGVTDSVCYAASCANIAYSRVPIGSDVMIDVSNSPIVTSTYTARVIVTGIHAMSRGKTLRTLFTTGPNYVDAEDNSNVAVRMIGGAECNTLPFDMADIVCDECVTAGCKVPVIVFGDGDSAAGCRTGPVPRFAIGASTDYVTAWANCAGWPQDPNANGGDFYPDYVRVWIR